MGAESAEAGACSVRLKHRKCVSIKRDRDTHTHTHTHIYIYVCVCVYVYTVHLLYIFYCEHTVSEKAEEEQEDNSMLLLIVIDLMHKS